MNPYGDSTIHDKVSQSIEDPVDGQRLQERILNVGRLRGQLGRLDRRMELCNDALAHVRTRRMHQLHRAVVPRQCRIQASGLKMKRRTTSIRDWNVDKIVNASTVRYLQCIQSLYCSLHKSPGDPLEELQVVVGAVIALALLVQVGDRRVTFHEK